MTNPSTTPESEVAHRRVMPEAWPGLLATIENSPGSIEAAQEVWDAAKELNIEELDENRYYAIGRAMCHYTRYMRPILTDSAQRQELIDDSARAVVDRSIFTKPTNAIAKVLEPNMRMALEGVPLAERVVGDVLDVQRNMRPRFPLGVHPAAHKKFFEENIIPTVDYGRFILGQRMTGDVLGAVGIIDNIVYEAQKSRSYQDYATSNLLPTSQDVSMLRTPHTLLWLKKLAARVPLEQARYVFVPSIEFDKDSQGVQSLREVDWKAVQAKMDERAKEWSVSRPLLRTRKLVCPAMHVDGMIDDFVALTVDILDAARKLERF